MGVGALTGLLVGADVMGVGALTGLLVGAEVMGVGALTGLLVGAEVTIFVGAGVLTSQERGFALV
jgi:hypothetical protein